jgi:peptide/nickel transport system substrate-binding protein
VDRPSIVQATSYGTAAANQLAIPQGKPWFVPYDRYRYDIDRAKALRPRPARARTPWTAGHQRVPADRHRGPGDRRQPGPAGHHRADPHRRLRHLARRAEQRQLRHVDDGLAGQHDPDDFYYAQHHTDGANNAQKFSDPRVDAALTPAAPRPIASAQTGLRRRATLIADQVSYIFLYNPAVIQPGPPALSGYEARRDKAIRFRDAALDGGAA